MEEALHARIAQREARDFDRLCRADARVVEVLARADALHPRHPPSVMNVAISCAYYSLLPICRDNVAKLLLRLRNEAQREKEFRSICWLVGSVQPGRCDLPPLADLPPPAGWWDGASAVRSVLATPPPADRGAGR